jgi:hypothetical protein
VVHALEAVRLPLQLALGALGSAPEGGALAQQQEDLLQLDDAVLGGVEDGYRVEGEVGEVVVVGRVASGQDEVLEARARAGDDVSIDFGLVLSVAGPHLGVQLMEMLLNLLIVRAEDRVAGMRRGRRMEVTPPPATGEQRPVSPVGIQWTDVPFHT